MFISIFSSPSHLVIIQVIKLFEKKLFYFETLFIKGILPKFFLMFWRPCYKYDFFIHKREHIYQKYPQGIFTIK